MNQVNLPEGASARLTMLEGSPCSIAEFVLYAEQCEYHEDPDRGTRFIMAGNAHGTAVCAIELDRLSGTVEAMTVYGQELDHFSNLNYLMQKAGWTACSVTSLNDDLNARLLARLVNVEVHDSNSVTSLPASTLRAPAPAANLHAFPVAGNETGEQVLGAAHVANGPDEHVTDAIESHQQSRALVIERNALDERCEMLETENRELKSSVDTLNAKLRSATASTPSRGVAERAPTAADPNSSALLQIINKHLLSGLELGGPKATEVVSDLRSAGFDVRLSVIALTPFQ